MEKHGPEGGDSRQNQQAKSDTGSLGLRIHLLNSTENKDRGKEESSRGIRRKTEHERPHEYFKGCHRLSSIFPSDA